MDIIGKTLDAIRKQLENTTQDLQIQLTESRAEVGKLLVENDTKRDAIAEIRNVISAAEAAHTLNVQEIQRLINDRDEWLQKATIVEAKYTASVNEAIQLRNEIARLRAGNFTPSELQSLCHTLPETASECAFKLGCEEYQRRLFGVGAIEQMRRRVVQILKHDMPRPVNLGGYDVSAWLDRACDLVRELRLAEVDDKTPQSKLLDLPTTVIPHVDACNCVGGSPSPEAIEELKKSFEQYTNGLQRYRVLTFASCDGPITQPDNLPTPEISFREAQRVKEAAIRIVRSASYYITKGMLDELCSEIDAIPIGDPSKETKE